MARQGTSSTGSRKQYVEHEGEEFGGAKGYAGRAWTANIYTAYDDDDEDDTSAPPSTTKYRDDDDAGEDW